MKAKELAEILLQHPELEVVVTGYEANLNPVKTVIKTKIKKDPGHGSYYGEYDHLGTRAFSENSQEPTTALYIGYSEGVGDGIDTVAGEVLIKQS
ncbi:hypothetical protein VF14_08925 [Nostoc linckia z18]|uniref:Uncharacterized protein n=2 Tax=Nostoc linckia TaxID=92942 RepID=A0A9Q5ZEN7_NOSLI|nr:hypothetical protein [Nostoc linckia]PHK42565.1 hypothetical protein VF12_02570 [Nostoc linckia z15]PHK44541.1 hypothetical protein VF13_21275 [Nostoc linckia z16]PHJ59585.1 hypothetical protein VF02_24550 [Nostoc linckia z1]PHJ65137.1 hypothetical protein VF05_21600 [Nostoc linckia z3]PHJ69590.1 hypothetical protein VF03_23630 [Nostoc linckia z2]